MGPGGTEKMFRAKIDISPDSGPGGGRGVALPLGRLVVSHEELAIRSALTGFIAPRSAGRAVVGDIVVDRRLRISLPIVHWGRREIVTFTDPASPLFGVAVTLPRRQAIVAELRARGYAVTDLRGT
jgi:hypothetical protein